MGKLHRTESGEVLSAAVELAKEIYRKIKAREKTQSEHLKRDYAKSIARDYKELLYYCQVRKINIDDVWEKVVNETIRTTIL